MHYKFTADSIGRLKNNDEVRRSNVKPHFRKPGVYDLMERKDQVGDSSLVDTNHTMSQLTSAEG